MIKIILSLSIVVNLVLMALVVGLMPFLLSLSIVVIGVLIWYISKLTSQLNEITDNFDDFYSKVQNYEQHVENIHGLEMFYGDQTLQSLMNHSRTILNDIYDFQEKFIMTEEEELEREPETPPQAEKEKSILYRDSPEGDS
tara:strand:+ start:574 stop:996 length:423 start_codon:yes stop_codon:yes gene_type:complete